MATLLRRALILKFMQLCCFKFSETYLFIVYILVSSTLLEYASTQQFTDEFDQISTNLTSVKSNKHVYNFTLESLKWERCKLLISVMKTPKHLSNCVSNDARPNALILMWRELIKHTQQRLIVNSGH